jgi:hypothetical protein
MSSDPCVADVETTACKCRSSVRVQPIAKIFSVSRAMAQAAVATASPYDEESGEDLLATISKLQDEDRVCRSIKANPKIGTAGLKDWSVKNGMLRWRDRIFVPDSQEVKREILQLFHDDPLAGHFGRDKTLELIQRRFHWRRIDEEVQDYILGCGVCNHVTLKRHKPYGKLQSLPRPDRPFSEISMDFITGLPSVYDGQRFVDSILVIVDRYTKFAIFLPVQSSITASELARLVHNEVELRFGAPRGIVTDRGSVFTSQFFSDLCYHSKVKRRLSTAFHAQTDGQTEILNQILERYLRCFVNDEQSNWPALLRSAEFAYNNSRNSTTGETPSKVLMGYQPEVRLDLADETHAGGVPGVHARLQKLEELRHRATGHWRYAVEAQAKHYDKRHQPMEFHVGQLVMMSTRNMRFEATRRKLAPRYVGPFRVLSRVGNQAYRLALPQQYARMHNVFPVSLLEPWQSNQGVEPLSMPPLAEDENEWEVEQILDKKMIDKEPYYLIKWKDWPPEYNSWQPEDDLENAPELLRAFERRK